ncbi:MAG: hypothetical protein Q8O87_00540 [bacterium]|nr:hypothetical protein [bacterium]
MGQQNQPTKGGVKRAGSSVRKARRERSMGRLRWKKLKHVLKSNGLLAAANYVADHGYEWELRQLANGDEPNQWRTRERAKKAMLIKVA